MLLFIRVGIEPTSVYKFGAHGRIRTDTTFVLSEVPHTNWVTWACSTGSALLFTAKSEMFCFAERILKMAGHYITAV